MIITDTATQYGFFDFPFHVSGIVVVAAICLYGAWQRSRIMSTVPAILLVAGILISWLIQPLLKSVVGVMTPLYADISLAIAMVIVLLLLYAFAKYRARRA